MLGNGHGILSFVLLLVVLSLLGCDDPVSLRSEWRTQPIIIDGNGTDWPETYQFFEKESKVLISVMNDRDNIYVRLLLRSKATQMMFLRAGFVTWIDDSGGSKKNFGVQFPLPKQNDMQRELADHKPRNSMQDVLEDSRHTLSVLKGPQGNRLVHTISMNEAAELGIYTCLGLESGYLVYELQVPYNASASDKTVGIGFETGELERPAAKKRPGGGDEMARGRGGQSRGGKGQRPSNNSPPEPFEMWATVQLADLP